ncbi:MAG: glycosyltransferase family 39 protein [Candidatus Muirbacterium halophilum]|nr:glycosyltransferase family 39 protein [Candidatus Muirbacterium halophilum]MCK9474818.1 glycosyltransferase family 39 protein [Candidatus Muirbacterium halophilum]
MKNKLFWIIFSIAILIRLLALNISLNDYLDWDEINSVKWNLECNNSLELIKWISNNDPHPPLFHLIMRFFMNIFGKTDITYKLVLFLFSILNCFLSYLLAKRLGFNRFYSLGFMLLFSLSPYEVFDVKRVYNSFLFFSMLNIILFYDFLNGKRKILYIISSVILFYYHFFAIFLVLPQIIIVFYRHREKLIYSLISVFIFLPYLFLAKTSPLYFFLKKDSHSNISWINPYGLGFFREMFHKYTGEVFYLDESILLIEFLIIVLIGIFSIKIIAKDLKQKNEIVSVYFISFLLLFGIGFIYQILFKQGIIEWNHISYLFPLFIFCIIKIYDKKWFYLIIVFLFTFSLIIQFKDYEYSEIKDLKRIIKEETPQNIYFFPQYYLNNIPYYLKNCKARIYFLKENTGFYPKENSILLLRNLGDNSNENIKTIEFHNYMDENFNVKTFKVNKKFVIYIFD